MKIRRIGLLVTMCIAVTAVVVAATTVRGSGAKARAAVRLTRPSAPAVAASANSFTQGYL